MGHLVSGGPGTADGNRLMRLMNQTAERGRTRVVVVWPGEELRLWWALREAAATGLAYVTTVGGTVPDQWRCALDHIEALSPLNAARQAVNLARAGRFDAVMNGLCSPDDLLRIAQDPEHGLWSGRTMTAVSVIDAERLGRLILVADPCLPTKPGLEQKAEMVRNAVSAAQALGIEVPRVAVLSATEAVNPKATSSQEAAQLSKMAQRGQIPGCLIDGPLALDNSVSTESARVKGIRSDVAGLADVLIAPEIETASLLVRAVTHLTPTVTATVVVGGCCPIALPSRSDSGESKLASLALAAWLAAGGT